jgi:excisionase family DNA binding protein
MTAGSESIRALATVTLDAHALDELGPATMDRLAELVEAKLIERRAAGAEPLLTPAAAAEIAGVHADTVRRAIRDGDLEVAGYVGTRARLQREAVLAWIGRGRPSPRSESEVPLAARARRREPARRVLGEALRRLEER